MCEISKKKLKTVDGLLVVSSKQTRHQWLETTTTTRITGKLLTTDINGQTMNSGLFVKCICVMLTI